MGISKKIYASNKPEIVLTNGKPMTHISRLQLLLLSFLSLSLYSKEQAKPVQIDTPLIEKELEQYYPADYLNQVKQTKQEETTQKKVVAPIVQEQVQKQEPAAITDEELEIEQEEIMAETHSAHVKELPDLKQSKETDLDAFNREIIKSKKPCVVKFTATWCGPCQQMAPAFSSAADHFGDKITFIEIDIDKCPAVAKKFRINSVPQMHFYNKGKKVTEVGGALTNPKQIIDQISMHLKIK